ncbi:MAG TPA: 5-formyltetrahydrofolate cyclo-ligase [Parasegetibacter sp.]
MLKSAIRKLYKAKREQLTESEWLKFDDLLLINFQQIDLPPLRFIHTYLPSEAKKEVETTNIVRYLQFVNPGLQVAVPKTDLENNQMISCLMDDDTEMVLNAIQIPEPVECRPVPDSEFDLILIPLLAFDKQGYRVGYGKGMYDRFLTRCRPDVIKVGLSFFEPVEEITDRNIFDVPLDICVTPQKVYEF